MAAFMGIGFLRLSRVWPTLRYVSY